MKPPQLYNRTRVSSSIPEKLRRENRWLELPLFNLLSLSDLAREGIANSGSYRFADHIYHGESSGIGWLGTFLDRLLLSMPAVRSFRNRYLAARDELVRFLIHDGRSGNPVDIVSAPCGLPRDLVEAATLAQRKQPGCLKNVRFRGIDLDPMVLRDAQEFAMAGGLPNFTTHQGDALDPNTYPSCPDFITSTGLAEFLKDEQLLQLYSTFHRVLKPGGTLFTSGMMRQEFSDYLLELVELHTHYRDAEDLRNLARSAGFKKIEVRKDRLGIQSLMVAKK